MARYGERVAKNRGISTVLNNGIDVEKYAVSKTVRSEMLSELGLDETTLIVGTVGRLTAPKNPFFLLDILSTLREKEQNFRFIWAGTGEMKDEIEAGINERGLNENVLMLGVRNDIPRVLQVLNVFILPSKFEGLPVIGVETQAAGVPMLCSDKVSPEVNMSKCVTFLPIDSTEPWVEGILKEKEFRRVENAASDVVKAGYDIKSTSQWITAFYEEHGN